MSVAAAVPLTVSAADSDAALAEIVAAPLRSDLILQRQLFRGKEFYVIKDPLALTYFRLEHEEGFLITQLDGQRTIGEVYRLFQERFPNREVTFRDIAAFVNQMSVGGLLNINARRFVYVARQQESVHTSWVLMWGKLISGVLFMRFPLLDPSPWLGRLTHAVRFAWRPWFVKLCLAFIGWTIFWLFVHRDAFAQNTINFFTPDNLFLIWITIVIVKTLHEFGHATTCRRFGGEVHEMGVCLMCFTPAGYVDASDAWMMRNKSHKLYTTMAGVFVEFVIASICAHLWLYLPPGIAKNLAFNAMIVASVNTVFFNANPLMKFDGYYVLSDVLEIPNLRTKAMAYCSYHIQRLLLGYRNLMQERHLGDERHNHSFIIYSVLAFGYMMTVIYGLTQVFARFLAPYGLHDFGLALGVFVEGSFAMFPVVRVLMDAFAAGPTNVIRQEGVWRRIAKWLIPLVVLCVVGANVPSRYEIHRQAVVVAAHSDRAGVEVAGVVDQVHVQTGQWVEAGQPLVTLRNDDVLLDVASAQLGYDAASTFYQSTQLDRTLLGNSQAPRIALSRDSQFTQLERAKRAADQLVVKAPSSGYVVTPDVQHLKGQFLLPGFNGIRIADLSRYKLLVPLTEAEAELIEVGSQVRGHTRASGTLLEGKIVVLPNQRAGWQDYQPAMLSAFGGPAPFEFNARDEKTLPAFALFMAEADLAQQPKGLMEGLRVKATITGKKATYGQRIWRWALGLWRSRTSM